MNIYEITDDKKQYMDLLFLADEQEEMIDKYIDTGTMFVLDDNGVKSSIVVLEADQDTLEIKNLATYPAEQHKGYGKSLIDYVLDHYKGQYHTLLVGTSDSPLTIPFYEKCGFRRSHIIKNFFIDHYDHDIIEDVVKLVDMVYLKRDIPE